MGLDTQLSSEYLALHKEHLASVLSDYPDGIIVVLEDGLISLWNDAMQKATGVKAEEVLYQPLWEVQFRFLPASERTEERYQLIKMGVEDFLREGTANWHNISFETVFPQPGGENVHLSLTTTAIKTDRGHILIQMARDITEQKKAEQTFKRYLFQLETLRQVGLELAAELSIETLLWMIAPRAIELLNGTAMSLYIHSPEYNFLDLAICLGDSQPPIEQAVRRGQGLAGRIWETGEAVLLEDYRTGNTGELARSTWGKVAGSPIIYGGEFLGVIFVYSTTAFDTTDLKLLGLFANHAGAAIRNARLHESLHELAIRDPLTHIFNRRHFFELAGKAYQHAQRYKRPLSVLVFDLDFYKTVNDTFGHLVGDQVLCDVVNRCSAEMRQNDVFGRYGGEEFVVLLPETDLKGALTVAERLRKCIDEKAFTTERGEVRVTISVGVAKIKRSGGNFSLLVDSADKALYRAKAAGRNCVSI